MKVHRTIDAALADKLLTSHYDAATIESDSNDGRCNVGVQVHPGIEVVRVFEMATASRRWEVHIDGSLARILDTIREGE